MIKKVGFVAGTLAVPMVLFGFASWITDENLAPQERIDRAKELCRAEFLERLETTSNPRELVGWQDYCVDKRLERMNRTWFPEYD